MQNQAPRNELHDFICRVTGAPAEIGSILEGIMRDDVFHSTLDWQSAAEMRVGARKAYKLYQQAPRYYDAERQAALANWEYSGAKAFLDDALARQHPEDITRARERFEASRARKEELSRLMEELFQEYFVKPQPVRRAVRRKG